jgi:hypothetical protein
VSQTLLREKDINPLHPWDTCLPLFISDPRYVLLPSVSARRDAFDEYCRDRARELRQENVKKEKLQANPKEEFDSLLHGEVKSTRTSWNEFRRTWKKDRRFYGWGRDDREREKRFKEYLKELGESMYFQVCATSYWNSWSTRETCCCRESRGRFLCFTSGIWHSRVGLGLERRKSSPILFPSCAEVSLP